jgi:hypothetical protein
MEDNSHEIISKLKFLGKIKKGEKINTRYMYVQPNGISTTFSRTFLYQDNRGNALNFVQETIYRAFELLISYDRLNTNDPKYLIGQHIVNDLDKATIGLQNLKFTYVSDTKFCCDMDTLLQLIVAKLQKYKKKKEKTEEKKYDSSSEVYSHDEESYEQDKHN